MPLNKETEIIPWRLSQFVPESYFLQQAYNSVKKKF